MYNLGYACINMALSYPKEWGDMPKGTPRITTNRSMIRRTFNERGLEYASALALQNCLDLEKIIEWNEQHDIKFYRMSSDIFPWASEYDFEELPDFEAIEYTPWTVQQIDEPERTRCSEYCYRSRKSCQSF